LPTDYTKVDLPKLKSDMLKWYSVIPPSAKEWWESFLEGIEDNICHAQQDTECPIYSLKNNLQRPITETEETAEISQRLRTLREKELAPLEEVNDYLINKKASNTVI
jgi:hypothetical protein